MDKKLRKNIMLLIAFAILLYVVSSNIGQVADWLKWVVQVISPLLVGVFLAFILNLLLNLYEKKLLGRLFRKHPRLARFRRAICLALTYLSALLLLSALIFIIIPSVLESTAAFVNQFVRSFPEYGKNIQKFLMNLMSEWNLDEDIWNKVPSSWQEIAKMVANFAGDALSTLFNLTVGVTTGVLNFFVGIIFSVYLLASKENVLRILDKLNRAFLNPRYAERVGRIASESVIVFGRFVGGQLIEGVILGSLCCIGMLILRLPYAPMISVLVGVTSLIPMLGSYLGAIPSALILLMDSPVKALIFMAFLIVLQQVEGNLIYPRVVGNVLGLKGIWVFLAIVLGGSFFGVVGMLIGVPVTAVVYTVLGQITNHKLLEREEEAHQMEEGSGI